MKRAREGGFALIASILANLILLAVGIVAFNLATQDLRISTRIVGEKKGDERRRGGNALGDAPLRPRPTPNAWSSPAASWPSWAAGWNRRSRVSISRPLPPVAGPLQVVGPAGYDMGSTPWVLLRYDTTITGRNDDHRSSVTVDVGLGYGPVLAEGYR